MDYVSQYNISASKVLGKLIPYFFRGRKLYALIIGLTSPLENTHEDFLKWAQRVATMTRLPFVKEPMEQMLKEHLGKYFKNENDNFDFNKYAHKRYDGAYVYSLNDADNSDTPVVYGFSEQEETASIYSRKEVAGSTANRFNLSAPDIANNDKREEYTTKIRLLLSQFTIIKKYDIIIQDF